MKLIKLFISVLICFFISNNQADAQINPLKKIKQKVEKKIDEKVDEKIDEAFEEKEKDDQPVKKEEKSNPSVASTNNNPTINTSEKENAKPELLWAKFDFVPGDVVIFEDNQLNEENGEFPSRWDLYKGNVENAKLGEDNVIMFRGGSPVIVPYLENPQSDYLPDVFTIEFDLYLPNNSFTLNFYDRKNQKRPSGETYLEIRRDKMSLSPASSMIPDKKTIDNKWAHIAIAYTRGKMKAYIDETRLINIPRLAFEPTGISLHVYHASNQSKHYIKNFRIAKGGVKYYDRVLQDGKIVSNGIRFDIGKASLKPESMGIINEIFNLMKEHSDINFSVEGHTDSDGDVDFNQKLSEERAKTVMNQLISMGIDKGRLSYKGYGESQPIDNNQTPEGKANNRRVEFVKTN